MIASTYDEGKAFAILTRILEPLKIEQAKEFETLAQADRELQQEGLRRVRDQYKSYQRNDNLPKPEDVAYFRQKVARLEDALTPLRIIENAMPGRLALGMRRARRGRLICTYDDLSFSALLQAAHTARGSLDLELLGRSWRGQVFDAAYLEGLQDQPLIAPKVWAIIIASAGYVFGTAVERILGRAAHIERYGLIVLLVIGLGVWLYHRWKDRRSAES